MIPDSAADRASKLRRMQEDHPYYCHTVLKIMNKAGKEVPFVLNKAQLYLHDQLEKQLEETGMIRALVLKGRQQGVSTYVSSRYYAKSIWIKNQGVFILSHHSKTTDALFRMVDRFHSSVPEPIRLGTPTHNLRQLEFSNGSRYEVGTAKTGEVGRGFTIQKFHGSEVAFYENTDELKTGVLQAIADEPGTEIILESTANGQGNMFHRMCMDALEGKSEYILVFIPWFWQDEYRTTPPADFTPTDEEYRLKEVYGLDDAQIAWRRKKIISLGSESLFMQEYPNTPHEAFQASGERLLDPIAVAEARKNTKTDPNAAIVLGVDPARTGDRTVLTIRQGAHVLDYVVYNQMDEMQLAGTILNYLTTNQVDMVFVDYGLGYGTVDRLHELGFASKVMGIQFGAKASDPKLFMNKRAEMASDAQAWFRAGNANIPDSAEFEMDLMAIPDWKPHSSGKKILPSKEDIRKVYGKSPDIFDSLILTFAFPVTRPDILSQHVRSQTTVKRQGNKGGLNTTRRISDIMNSSFGR